MNLESRAVGIYESELWDTRDPVSMGEKYVYSNDKYGIFNLYLSSENQEGFLTNVSGGAFMPHVNNKGQILFNNAKVNFYLGLLF